MSATSSIAKIGGIAGGIAGEIASRLLGDLIDASGDIARTEAIIRLGIAKSWFAEAFDSMVEGTPNATIGMSPDGMIEVANRMLRATAYFGLAVGAEVAEELFMEMIQEGFSNSIQTSVGGALQTMLNVWRGGMPPNPDELEAIVGQVPNIDEDTLALLIAMSGNNIPTTFFRVSRGFDQYVDNDIRLIREQLIDALNKLNRAISWLYERSRIIAEGELDDTLAVLKEMYSKGINLLDHIAERALSRLQELKTECQTAKNWLEYSTLYPETPLITELEASYVAIENLEEARATYNTYQSIKQTIEATLNNADIQIKRIIEEIDGIIGRYVSHLNKVVQTGAIDYTEIMNKISNALEKVKAYRGAIENQTTPESPITMTGVSPEVIQPKSVEASIEAEAEYQIKQTTGEGEIIGEAEYQKKAYKYLVVVTERVPYITPPTYTYIVIVTEQ